MVVVLMAMILVAKAALKADMVTVLGVMLAKAAVMVVEATVVATMVTTMAIMVAKVVFEVHVVIV